MSDRYEPIWFHPDAHSLDSIDTDPDSVSDSVTH